jgi:glycosyltransferase involved in cell wall biosynthesis
MKRRVLVFSTAYFPLVGGAEVAMKEITDRIPGIHFDLVCAKISPGVASKERIGNVTVHRVGFGHPTDKFLLPVAGTLRAFLLGEPDVVWSLMASFGGFAALTYTWLRPSARLLLTLQEGGPLEHYNRRAGPFSFLHRMIFRRADAIHAISHFLADWAVNMGARAALEIVPNGVDLARFGKRVTAEERSSLRQSYGFKDDDVVVITASRLTFKNGVDDLVRAFSLPQLPEQYKVLIAGDGEDRVRLQKLVESNHLQKRATFLGLISHEDLPRLLQAGDIFVRASRSEGLGNAFLEAMAVGLPIVGTPVGGILDFLTDGETGVFCRPDDPVSIAAAIRRVADDPDLRQRLIRNGARLVHEKYDWDGIAARVQNILGSL